MRSGMLGILALLVGACSATAEVPTDAAAVVEPGDGVAVADGEPPIAAVQVGDWASYGEPAADEWSTAPLSAARWANTAAELACAGRANHGDPGAHTAASRRILAHHETTAEAVMAYGIEINADPQRAHALGEIVAAATETCR